MVRAWPASADCQLKSWCWWAMGLLSSLGTLHTPMQKTLQTTANWMCEGTPMHNQESRRSINVYHLWLTELCQQDRFIYLSSLGTTQGSGPQLDGKKFEDWKRLETRADSIGNGSIQFSKKNQLRTSSLPSEHTWKTGVDVQTNRNRRVS